MTRKAKAFEHVSFWSDVSTQDITLPCVNNKWEAHLNTGGSADDSIVVRHYFHDDVQAAIQVLEAEGWYLVEEQPTCPTCGQVVDEGVIA